MKKFVKIARYERFAGLRIGNTRFFYMLQGDKPKTVSHPTRRYIIGYEKELSIHKDMDLEIKWPNGEEEVRKIHKEENGQFYILEKNKGMEIKIPLEDLEISRDNLKYVVKI